MKGSPFRPARREGREGTSIIQFRQGKEIGAITGTTGRGKNTLIERQMPKREADAKRGRTITWGERKKRGQKRGIGRKNRPSLREIQLEVQVQESVREGSNFRLGKTWP